MFFGEREKKDTALSHFTFRPDSAAVGFNDSFGDGKPETRTLNGPSSPWRGKSMEFFENEFNTKVEVYSADSDASEVYDPNNKRFSGTPLRPAIYIE